MKVSSRSAPIGQDATTDLPPGPPTGASPSAWLPGLWVILAGVLVAALLVWLGLPPPSARDARAQLAQTVADGQAAGFHQALNALLADTQAAAGNPMLLKALQSQDRVQLESAQNSLRVWDHLVDAQLNLRGQAEQNVTLAAPMTFSALDQLRRAEAGQVPALEAVQAGQRWLVYSVAPVRDPANGAVAGTLLLAYDLQRLLQGFATLPADAGQLTLQQRFANGPAQVLLQRGTASGLPPLVLDSGNPNWTLSFTPGAAYQASTPWLSLLLMALAALVATACALAAMRLATARVHAQIHNDARQLEQLIDELAGGKAVKAFSLRLAPLNALAVSLARFSLRGGANGSPSTPPVKTRAPVGGATGPARFGMPGDGLSDPIFQDTGILDEAPDEPAEPVVSTAAAVPPAIAESIFRAYDIRGVVGSTLHPQTAYWIGRAIGAQSLAQGEPQISVGRDGRLSGPMLVEQLIHGLRDAGCHVSDVGLVPTPALYYATQVLGGRSGVMLTGSHNPPDYNGFKVVIAGDTLANEQILALHQRLANNDLSSGAGSVTQVEILERYFKEITGDVALARRMKVVIDCGNGVAGVIAPRLIEALNCEVIPLFCEVDGHFPNHHPDPSKPENLRQLIAKVKDSGADLGLAFDGDGDRIGVVTDQGTIIYPDRLLMLFARDVVMRNPGADVIFDVKCSRRLGPLITRYGGRPVMWKTGHSLIKKHMKLTGALLAGEMSGHIFFKERWFGFDDGIYTAARLLEILSQERQSAEALFATFPNDLATPEIHIAVTEQSKFSLIDALARTAQWGPAQLTRIDGLRVDYPTGWGLVRASNTTPMLVLRFEADSAAELQRIQQIFHQQLKAVAPELQLPF
jgi:phosphomannomutase/phosphoglucomutase